MADAGHEVHVVTNSAAFGSIDRDVRERVHRQGKLTVHRYDLLDEQYQPPPDASFYGVPPGNVRHPRSRWARDVATLTALRLAEAVAELHAQHRFDVVEVPDMFAEGFFLARRRIADGSASLPPICVLGHTSSRETYRAAHDAWQLGGEAQRHRMRLEDACLTEADALVTPSQSLMDRYEAWFGAALPRVRAVIPNFFGVPASGTTGALPTELQGTGPLLLVIGRVEPRKGCDVALAAFAQLCQQFPDLRLAFVGGADHWWPGESFRALCDAWLPPADRQRVLLPGLLPYEQVFAAARSAAVVLHPSRWDNWPNAVLEAMSVGACCVVSDHGGQAEMVEHGRSGMVFPTEDATALAGILRELLRDPARRAALGAAAVARVASLCDPRKVLSAKLAVYRAAAAARQQVDEVAPPSVVVVDAGGADAAAVATSVAAIDDSCSDSVTKYLLTDAAMPLPPQWRPWIRLGSTPWSDAPAHAVIVWLRAGARPDRAGFAALLRVARDGGGSGGGSLWLEPEHELRCHPADLSLHDICLVGAGLPAVVATAARHLARCRSLLGAHTPVARLATIAAMMAIASGRAVRHTGDTGGRDHGAALVLGSEDLTVVLGRLTVERLIDGSTVLFGA
jgi:glycosyltransferase involved in cell wall biosynthesis